MTINDYMVAFSVPVVLACIWPARRLLRIEFEIRIRGVA